MMKDMIIKLEERLRLAMLNSDLKELDLLISPELLFTNHNGLLVSKEDDLYAHASKIFEFQSLDLSHTKIRLFERMAIVSVKADIKSLYHGKPAKGEFRFTRIWSKTKDDWQVVAVHSSEIP